MTVIDPDPKTRAREHRVTTSTDDERARADQLFQLCPVPLLSTDQYGRITGCNRKAAVLLGSDVAKIFGTSLVTDWLVEDLQEVEASLLARATATQWTGAKLHVRGVESVPVHARVVLTRGSTQSSHLWALQDLRGGRPKRPSTEDNERFAVLSHELRGPLSCMQASLDLLITKDVSDQARSRAGDVIRSQVDQMTRLVTDLLDVARGRNGKLELSREPVRLRPTVEQAMGAVRAQIDGRGQSLVVEFPGDPVIVMADQGRLVQILSNLLENASKYTPDGGKLGIRVTQQDREAIVVVWDDGVGIPAEATDRLFEMFEQGLGVPGRKSAGLGVGLSLATVLVRLHGGRIRAMSPRPGGERGSAFEVALPCADVLDRPPREVEGTAPATPKRVLVVEDDSTLGELFVELLRSRGHDVAWVSCGGEAIAHVDREVPELVLCDIGLPDMPGHEVARRVRRVQPRLRMIAMSGAPTSLCGGQDDPFDAHLTKPVSMATLERLLSDDHRCHQPITAPSHDTLTKRATTLLGRGSFCE